MPRNSLHQFQNTGVAELRGKNPAIIACWRGLVPLTERSRIPVFLTGERLKNFQDGKAEPWNFFPDSSFTHALRIFYKGQNLSGNKEGFYPRLRMVSVQVQHRYFDILSVSRYKEHPDSAFIFFIKIVANKLNSIDFPGQKIKKEILDKEKIFPEDCIFRKDLLFLSCYSEKIKTDFEDPELKKKVIEMRQKGQIIERVWTRLFEDSIEQLVSRGSEN